MSWISSPAYSIMVKALTCLALGGCIGGIPLGTSYLVDKDGQTKEKHPLSAKEKKERVLKEINSKNCYVTASGGQEESKFGAIYMCPSESSTSGEDSPEISREAESLYYLEEEDAFEELDSSESPMSLFKKVKGFQYKKEGSSGPYLLLDLGGGIKKQISVDSSDRWQLFGGLSTHTVDGESVTEIATSPSN